jgi:tetratricopeptide (TPR) repeat protein
MSKKCPLCNKGKSRRICIIRDDEIICSKCCAEIRNSDCIECEFYASNNKYDIIKAKNSATSKYIMMLSPQIDDEVDVALEEFERGQVSIAEEKIKGLFNKYPDYHQTNYAMGVIEIQKDNVDKALVYLNKATELYPLFSEAFYNKAIIYKNKSELAMMSSEFLSLMEIEDSSSELYKSAKELIDIVVNGYKNVSIYEYIKSDKLFKKAFTYLDVQDYQTAKEYFEKAIVVNSETIQSYGNLGLCCMALGEREEAFRHLYKALELDPNYEPAILHIHLLESKSSKELKEHFATVREVKDIRYYKDYSLKKDGGKSLIEELTHYS